MPQFKTLKSPRILVITFIGSHRFGIYKDCRTAELRLQNSLEQFNTPFLSYSLSNLINILGPFNSGLFYLFTRYGVGAWFWKPIIINHALASLNPDYLIYVDADCVFTTDPTEIIEAVLVENDLAFFSQTNALEGWISGRAVKILQLSPEILGKAPLLTAGIVFLRNTERSRKSIGVWGAAMKDPRLLLHPIFRRGRVKHLHDQAILSSLVAQNEVDCSLVHTGFYSMGIESNTSSLKEAWIYTGNIFPADSMVEHRNKMSLILDYYSRNFYDVLKTVFVFPIHLFVYLLERKIPRK